VTRRGATALDTLAVLVFVAIGRAAHAEGSSVAGFARTAWPFLAGLALGWAVPATRRTPGSLVPAGVCVWLAVVGGGMALRAVSGQGVAAAFVGVALAFLGLFLLGWRAALIGVAAVRSHPGDDRPPAPPAVP
jgi:hypothetical protein